MWNFTQDDWLREVKRSLKSESEPRFSKKITTDHEIFPFSSAVKSQVQRNLAWGESFLTIQNYSDLAKAGLGEWIRQSDVGLRFRQLSDVVDLAESPLLADKSIFLSQPFPFPLSETAQRGIELLFKNAGRLNMGWSPLSFGLTRGEILKRPFAGWENIFTQDYLRAEGITWFYLSSAPYQWAGAEPHVELSVLLSHAYSILKELDAIGLPVETVRSKISFGLSLGTDVLIESGKITALKVLWDRLFELVSDNPSGSSAEVYGLPSLRYFSGRDPWNNIMRVTLMAFAALTGGAQGFKCIPFDALNRHKSPDAIRVSTNIPLILKNEGFLNQVENPYDGSSLFKDTVDQLCASAWAHFQEIERKGGVFEAVRSGWLQSEIKRSGEASKNTLSYREKELVGVNKFVAKDPHYGQDEGSQLVRLNEIIDPLFLKKSDDDYLSVEPLMVSAIGYDWEKMQCLSDKYLYRNGERPSVTVIKGGGPIVEKKAAWLQTLLHLGGMEPRWFSQEDIGELESHQSLVIILPGNEESEDRMVSALKNKGMEKIWSTGSDRAVLAIDRYIDVKASALEFVEGVHRLRVEIA